MATVTPLKDALTSCLMRNGEVNQELTIKQLKQMVGKMLASEDLYRVAYLILDKMTNNRESEYHNLDWTKEKRLLREAILKATGATIESQIKTLKPKKQEEPPTDRDIITEFQKVVSS